MFCKNCGAQIADQASFCPNCGANTKPATQQPAAQPAPATNLQSVLNVGSDVSKILNYVTLICFALAGFLWIYTGASSGSGASTERVSDWFFDLGLSFLPVLIGQGFAASAIATFFVRGKAKCACKKTLYLTSAITGIITYVLTICCLYSFIETSATYEISDMNFAAWMVLIAGFIGTVCAIVNYVQSKKNN